MKPVRLEKLLRKEEVINLIWRVAAGRRLRILDPTGRPLFPSDATVAEAGQNQTGPDRREEVIVDGRVTGFVEGGETTSAVVSVLEYMIRVETEKKELTRETLDKYKEINFLYDFSERIASCLELDEITILVALEARRLMHADNASVMLLDEDELDLRIFSALGGEFEPKTTLKPGTGIAGHVLKNGRAEIVNDVDSDPRYEPGAVRISSLVCAPLKTGDKTIGVINISTTEPHQFTSADLKLLTALASQAASALETAILHQKRVKAELVKSNLARYVAPQLLDAIINEGEAGVSLSSEKRRITVLFSDIRNFTATCESLVPEQVVAYLNEYFTHMVDVIFAHEGTVNKFVGDMIVALFGAPSGLPENESQAIRAAIRMQESLRGMSNHWIRDNFHMGIGINSGDVVVGNIGSPQHMDYTAIGDDVNVASRLQSLAGEGQVLVSRSVYDATRGDFEFREIGNLNVKGKANQVEVFEVLY